MFVEKLSVPRRKKNDGPPRDDTAVKVDREIIRLAKAVAAYRQISLAEYLSETLRQPVTRDFDSLSESRHGADHTRPKKKP